MMNKIIATAVMATVGLSSTSANAKVFNGFSVGANGGAFIAHLKTKTGEDLRKSGIIHSKSSTDNIRMCGIQLQYECSKADSFYWGLGLDFAYYFGKSTTILKHKEINNDGHYDYENILNLHTSNRYLYSDQLDARLGWNFHDKTIVYGLMGLKFQKIKYSVREDREVDGVKAKRPLKFKTTNTKPVFVLGAGTAVKVSDKVSIGIEYRYSFEKSKSLNHKNVTYVCQKNSSHAILAKVSYHF